MNITNNDKSWNKLIEKNIIDISEKSKGYKIMHIQECRKISFIYDNLMYFGIILGPLSGLISGIGAILNSSSDCAKNNIQILCPVLAVCIGFISGIVVAITKYGKFEEKNSQHKLAASKYISLESNINRQLTLCRIDRINASCYLEWVGNSFDELFLTSPLVAKKIYNDYIIIASQNGIKVPDEYSVTFHGKNYQQDELYESLVTIQQLDGQKPPLDGQKPPLDGQKPDNLEFTRNSYVPDINKFSDNRMGYEMQRMLHY